MVLGHFWCPWAKFSLAPVEEQVKLLFGTSSILVALPRDLRPADSDARRAAKPLAPVLKTTAETARVAGIQMKNKAANSTELDLAKPISESTNPDLGNGYSSRCFKWLRVALWERRVSADGLTRPLSSAAPTSHCRPIKTNREETGRLASPSASRQEQRGALLGSDR